MIVYVVDEYPSLSQTFVRNEVEELRRQGVAVHVVALERGHGAQVQADTVLADLRTVAGGVASVRAWASTPLGVARMTRQLVALRGEHARLSAAVLPLLAARLRAEGMTHVHSHFAWGASAVGSALARLAGVPFSVTVHARDLYVDRKHLGAKLRAATSVVTVCEYNRPLLVQAGADRSRITLVRCGVDIPVTPVDPADADIDVLAVGRLVPKKGYPVLLRAISRLRDDGLAVRAVIVGDGEDRAAIEALVYSLSLRGLVDLQGSQPHDVTLQLMERARVLAMPAVPAVDGDSDAFPVVIYEAMARGVPVVASDLAGIPEMVDADTGWLVRPDDVDALALALGEALSRPELAGRRAAAARARVAREANASTEVAKLRRQVLTGAAP